MRVNIKPATKGMYHHSYDVSTIMSLDLGQLIPSRVFEVVERDEINRFHGKAIVRLAPQDFPAYGKLYYKTAAFFVPDHQIIAYASALRSDMNMYKGKAVATPHIHHWQIAKMFYDRANTTNGLCDTVNNPSSPSEYDFTYPDYNTPSTLHYCKLTTLGRIFYKTLKSLGYDFPSFHASATDHLTNIGYADTPLNILPLLSYCKIYCDYFMNSHFYNSNVLVALLHAIHDCESFTLSGNTYFDSSTFEISTDCLYFMIDSILVPFEQNMYTTAWNTPNSPTGVSPESQMNSVNTNGVISPYRNDVVVYASPDYLSKEEFSSSTESTSIVLRRDLENTHPTVKSISDLGLRYLRAISDFVRRNNLFGSRAVERLLARFGIKNDDYKAHYAHKLYEGQDRIDFSAVMSNADTTGKSLASYAGFGVGSLDIDFNYKSDSNGFIVVLSWLQETPIWIRGTLPYVLRNHSLDWYNPEFDGESIRAIPIMEFTSNKTGDSGSGLVNGDKTIYGFTDLYDEYRYERDTVLGDFVLDDNSTRNFFFGRDLSKSRERAISLKPQTNTVQYYNHLPNDQLTNPFQFSASVADRFYIQIDWDIDAQRVIRSKSDALMLNGEGSLDVPVGGHLID